MKQQAALIALFCLLVPAPALATTPAPVVLSDEGGDGRGPGSYRLPHGEAFRAGSFDLVEVTLRPDGDTVEIRARVRTRLAIARHARVATDAAGDYPLLQLDIYVDRDGVPGFGHTRTVPGRRVVIDEASAWEHAVLVTALPGRVRSALDRIAPELSEHVYVTAPSRFEGAEIIARVPASALGGVPQPHWGYTVLASSVTLSTSVRGVLLGEGDDPNVYTRDVRASAGTCENWEEDLSGHPCTFGGCDPCGGHPRVLDAIVAGSSRDQLRRYRVDRWAVLHALVPDGSRAAPAPSALPPVEAAAAPAPPTPTRCQGGGRFAIQDRDGELLTIAADERSELDGIEVGRIATLLDEEGRTVGRALLTGRKGTVCLLERLEPAEAGSQPPAFAELNCR